MQSKFQRYFIGLIFCSSFLFGGTAAVAQTSAFTYQGKLTDNSAAPTATYQMRFSLFDAANNQVGATVSNPTVSVANGIFTVNLDFGAEAFSGTARFLQISVFSAAANAFVDLTPRQLLTSAPYAVRSLNSATADTATNAAKLGNVPANQFVQTTDTRLSDSRDPAPGSGNYIQNQNGAAQVSANFNISGSGTSGGTLSGNAVNSATQYNLGGNRVLSAPGTANTFAGVNAGAANTDGINNAFFGTSAGAANTEGLNNAFFGTSAGKANTIGVGNSFFGSGAGFQNTTGFENTFVGSATGFLNTTGSYNSFFGWFAGYNNTTADSNSFFGDESGRANTTGAGNSFFGASSGRVNTTGKDNSFFGMKAGELNTDGVRNSFFGKSAGAANTTGYDNAFFGAEAGESNTGGFTNSFFGSQAGGLNTTGYRNSFFGEQTGGANTTGIDNAFFGNDAGALNTMGKENSFFGSQSGRQNTTGNKNSFFGGEAGYSNTTGISNAFFGDGAGSSNTTGNTNSFFGSGAGNNNTTGSNNTVIGNGADVNSVNLTHATAIGAGAVVSTSNTVVLGTSFDDVRIPGNLILPNLGAAGSTSLCRNGSNEISTCTAGNFSENGGNSSAMLDAMRTQNTQMLKQLAQQQLVIDELKKAFCQMNPQAEICPEEK